jgi:choline dehydrogenase
VRGNPADFDGWAQMGCRSWSFDDVLPYFRKSEDYAPGDAEFRGKGGPLRVEDYRTILPLTHRFVEAAQQAGFAFSADLNGKTQEGVGYSQMTRKGRFRGSTAQTFLAQARSRTNLRVETDAMATRLLLDGMHCVGVAFRQRGLDREVRAAREVILCGGAVNSPHLLQISGIGPAAHLQAIGVPVVHDLGAVGGNLQDHYVARISHRAKNAVSINQLAHGVRLAAEAVRFVVTGRGALTFGVTSAQVFCRSREGLASPDLQLLFTPASYDAARFGQLEYAPGMTVAVCPVRPDSRGTIMARSADPFAAPIITPNYLSAANDQRVLNAGVRITRQIFASPALAQHSVEETLPGPAVVSDDALADYARRYGTTIFHPVGTCRMGEGPNAVVDSRLRVRGMGGLRVIDASVMPTLTTGNTNAPTIMIAEKGAAMIREDAAG